MDAGEFDTGGPMQQRSFLTRTILCLLPTLLATGLVVKAYFKDPDGLSGFKLGNDLSGGTILVYEVDQELSKQSKGADAVQGQRAKADSALAEALKRRIDGNDLKGIIVRPLGDSRVEIILPYGAPSAGKQAITSSDVEEVKQLIKEVGSLEFRIIANNYDDGLAIQAAKDYFAEAVKNKDSAQAKVLDDAARVGIPPPFPNRGINDAEPFMFKNELVQYAWVELSKHERADMGLSSENPGPGRHYDLSSTFAIARGNGTVVDRGRDVYYSRDSRNERKAAESEKKKYDYFVLTRLSEKDRVQVGGDVTITASVGQGKSLDPTVSFSFNSRGAEKFYQMTMRNRPEENKVVRQLGIILDGLLISAPNLNEAIRDQGQISGSFKRQEVERMVMLLRSGALPATLKGEPVSENTIGATLGADTIKSGTRAVLLAFVAILIFMMVYYRFAGMVATIALLANLVLTVGFMVAVNATFTLPGLAGLVLMLGMAVDANVLIYERVREERDRGMNLITALRNGYDRALPTIIDTHLSSIFTAIVLYTVGNDQLKGFGVSLTVGLAISLFTSLVMTRLFFDFWQSKNWLRQLRMMRLFSRPNIDFMKIRKIMFTTTAIFTVVGLSLFLMRGKKGLNVDFVGGTTYTGQLKEAAEIGKLRDLVSEDAQAKRLKVDRVEEVKDQSGKLKNTYSITYSDGKTAIISLANAPEGSTPEAKEADVKRRASRLPDHSVEQVYTSGTFGASNKFRVRTTEREKQLVQAAIIRLFANDAGTLLTETTATAKKEGADWVLDFSTPVSKSFVKTLLERQFQREIGDEFAAADVFDVVERGEPISGSYPTMVVKIQKDANNGIASLVKEENGVKRVLEATAAEVAAKPQAEGLETFDGTLASETQTRALYAIIASWAAILLYLWFRFGNWTFGAAAVICLIHDLCFTLGCIALCYYVHDTTLGKMLGLQDFKIDFPAVAALLTLVGYSVNDTIVVFDRIREVRGKSAALTSQMINDSVNQTLSRTVLASFTTFLVVIVLYIFGGEGVHLFAFVMVVGVIVGTYSSIYIASPLLLIFGEGKVRNVVGTPVKAVAQPV